MPKFSYLYIVWTKAKHLGFHINDNESYNIC